MIIPYSTDKTDNFIGYGAVGIMVACVLAFFITWPVHSRVEKRIVNDSLMVWVFGDKQATDTADNLWSDSPRAVDPFQESDRGSPAVELPPGVQKIPGMESVEDFEQTLARNRAEAKETADSLAKRIQRVVARESPLYTFGFYPKGGHWLPGLITHQFLHGGWMHLIGNLIFFFAFGVAIERRFGLKAFLGIYLVGGVFAALCQTGATTGLQGHLPDVTMVGASGSIAAIMGAFLRSYPTSRVKVFVWLFRPMLGQIPAWVFLGMWVIMEFLRSHFLMRHQEGGGTAYMAHVAGFFFGFVVAPFLPVTDEAKEMEEHEKMLTATGPLPTWSDATASPRSPFSLPGDPPTSDTARSPFSLPTKPAPTGPPVYERPSTALADQGWDALERGEDLDAVALLQKQFQHWMRGGSEELALLAEQILRIRRKRPSLEIAPLVLYECGTRLAAVEAHSIAARFCLEKVEESLADLPPSLLSRCRTLLESMPEPAPEAPAYPSAPSPSIPPIQSRGPYLPPRPPPGVLPPLPPPRPAAPGAGTDGRPSWMTD